MPNWLVPSMRVRLVTLNIYIFICVFLVLYFKTMSLSSLKIMKKSPITEYSDKLRVMSFTDDNLHTMVIRMASRRAEAECGQMEC